MLFTFLLAFIICLLTVGQSVQNLEPLFEKTLARKDIHNGFLLIHSDSLDLRLSLSKGTYADGRPVSVNTPFHVASVGKTFTATTILMLAEEGKLNFDDPAAKYLPADILQGLHMIEGVDYGDQITIVHLLQHRSGLPDYFEDEPVSGENMMSRIFSEPERHWEPEALIQFTKQHFQARFKPGTDYHYTDTEYILLGLIIEQLEGKPLHQVFAERIFLPLDMTLSSMHLRSEPIANPDHKLAELYAGTYEISRFKSLSADWAGGGLLSTSEDLYRFMKALQQGELVRPATYLKMQQWTEESLGFYYGFGLRKIELVELNPALSGLSLVGHSGTSSAFMYYCPELDTYLTGTFNQIDYHRDCHALLAEVLLTIRGTL